MASGKKKTHEEFIEDLSQINSNIEVLGTYKNSKTKIRCRCKKDGYEWEVVPNSLIMGRGCPVCGNKIKNLKQRKTHQQFIKELHEVNPSIEVLSHYVNSHTKIRCKCKIDEHIWETIPASLLSGIGCPKCGYRNNGQKRTKTHEKFIEELKQINPNIVVMGTYVNNKTSIRCRCTIDGHEWQATPSGLLQGQGCPKCGRISATQKTAQKLTKTHGQFLQELQQVNSDIEVLETYKNGHTKIKVRCKICGHKWEAEPSNLIHGHKTGCPICAINNRKKTHEQFIEDLYKINQDIEVLGTYVASGIKIKVRCKLDGYEWETRPNDLLKGVGCPKCKGRKQAEQQTKTHEQFIRELAQVNKDIEVLGTYTGTINKIKVKCKIDGYEWETWPANLLYGHGCPKCVGRYKTQEEFIQQLQQINPDIEVLGTYINSSTKIKCRCRIDEHEWEATPNSLLQGSGCPICNTSKGEQRVAQYLQDNNISYISQYKFNDCRFKLPLPFDFYLPQYNTCIEYDGAFHYNIIKGLRGIDGLIDTKIRDTVKNIYCENNNITLVRIAYWDYDNIEKILDSYLKQEELAL